MSNKPKVIEQGVYKGNIKVLQAYNPLIEKLKPLDFFCTCGLGTISYGIRAVTSNLSSDRESEFNHTGIFPDGSACTLEALWTLTSTNFFEQYEGNKVIIARWNKMTPKLVMKALKKTNKHIGQLYPSRRILLHLINVAHIFHWSKSLVCSEYVAKILFKAGARHGYYHGTTPDALSDEFENQLNDDRTGPKYSIIFKDKLPYNFYRLCNACETYWLVPGNLFRCPKCKVEFSMVYNSINEELNKETRKYNSLKSIKIFQNQ